MATDKDNKYDYKKVSLYFDLSNPYQNEAYNFIQKAGHKKTTLIGILVHHFLQQFGQAELSETDLKNYIQSYSTICKANMSMTYIQHHTFPVDVPKMIPTGQEQISRETNRENSTLKNISEVAVASNDAALTDSNNSEEKISDEDMDYINAMMNSFSL